MNEKLVRSILDKYLPVVHGSRAGETVSVDSCEFALILGVLMAALHPKADDSAEELKGLKAILKDPVAIHLNILNGKIARPTWGNIKHLYQVDFIADIAKAIGSARINVLEEAAKCAEGFCGGKTIASYIRFLKDKPDWGSGPPEGLTKRRLE